MVLPPFSLVTALMVYGDRAENGYKSTKWFLNRIVWNAQIRRGTLSGVYIELYQEKCYIKKKVV